MAPTFSIVIPAYNRPFELDRALRSCLQQSYPSFEIIVVDDGSASDLRPVICRWNDHRIRYTRQQNQGPAAARNLGVARARGEFIAFLDSDDVFLANKLAECLKVLRMHEGAACFSRSYVDRGLSKYWIKPSQAWDDKQDIFDYIFVHQGWVPLNTLVIPREVVRSVKFQEDIRYGDDIQYAIDLVRSGTRLLMIEKPLSVYTDTIVISKLSQMLKFDRRSHRNAFVAWVEANRECMTPAAYLAFRASVVSRLLVDEAPVGALQEIFNAWAGRAFGMRRFVSQCLLTFMPRTYRTLCDLVVRGIGVRPSSMAGEYDPSKVPWVGLR